MVSKPEGGRFAFIDASATARRLGIDRVTLDLWVKEGRLKARGGFFRASDVEALNNELHPVADLADVVNEDEQDSAGDTTLAKPARKKQDPQMRVYLRLQADTKWFDISEDDIHVWFEQLAPDGFERNKRNVEHTIRKLQLVSSLIEDAQKREAEQA
jgi:hypothetical protein